MAKYNPKSLIAEEFISDEEIRATLEYAEANKNNVENNAEADSNNDAGADERGDMFNNGDY